MPELYVILSGMQLRMPHEAGQCFVIIAIAHLSSAASAAHVEPAVATTTSSDASSHLNASTAWLGGNVPKPVHTASEAARARIGKRESIEQGGEGEPRESSGAQSAVLVANSAAL